MYLELLIRKGTPCSSHSVFRGRGKVKSECDSWKEMRDRCVLGVQESRGVSANLCCCVKVQLKSSPQSFV